MGSGTSGTKISTSLTSTLSVWAGFVTTPVLRVPM